MKPKNRLTLGLKLLQVLTIIAAILAIVGFVGVIAVSSSWGISGIITPLHIGYEIFGVVFYILLFITIRRPGQSLYRVVMALLTIDLILSVVFIFIPYQTISSNIFSILIDAVVLWYFLKIKDYFVTGSIDRENLSIKKVDKHFVVIVVILLILGIIGPLVIGLGTGISKGISEGKQTVQLMKTLQGKTTDQALAYCQSLSADQQNKCFIFIITLSNNPNLIGTSTPLLSDSRPLDVNTCSLMNGDKGKVTCYAVFNRCDLVSDNNKVQQICKLAAIQYQAKLRGSQ
jgi:hypothetical protein